MSILAQKVSNLRSPILLILSNRRWWTAGHCCAFGGDWIVIPYRLASLRRSRTLSSLSSAMWNVWGL
jgi:hypothetical protein